MAEVQPPNYLTGGCYTAQSDRNVWASLFSQPGIVPQAGGGLEVTPGGGMQVFVAPGMAWIEGTEFIGTPGQGYYFVVNDAPVAKTLPPPDTVNPRIDLIVARVRDSDYSGAADDWVIEVISGTPAAVPLDPAAPGSSLVLARITVPANDAIIDPSQIEDQRFPAVLDHEIAGIEDTLEYPLVWESEAGTPPDIDDGSARLRVQRTWLNVEFTLEAQFGAGTTFGDNGEQWSVHFNSTGYPASASGPVQVFQAVFRVGSALHSGFGYADPLDPGVAKLFLDGSPATPVAADTFAWGAGDGFALAGRYVI